jgi:DNA-binding CsgD family transcriptional regulator
MAELCAVFSSDGPTFGGLGLITGGIGTGKTDLLEKVAGQAALKGLRVISASCSPTEKSLPYAMADQLFRELALSGELPLMPEELLPDRRNPEPSSELLRFFEEITATIIADRPALLLAIDDIQYADEASLHCLLYIYRRFQAAPVTIVATHGAQFSTDPTSPLGELLFHPRVRRVSVGPLTCAGLSQILGSQQRPHPWQAEEVLALTQGNPLLVTALLRDPPRQEAPASVGEAFVHATIVCIHRSGPAGLRVVRAMAVLGGNTSIELVCGLSDLDVRTVERTINVFADTGILSERGFRHPQVQAALLDGLAPDEAAHLHRKAAELLHEEGISALTLAEHLLASGPVTEPWAGQVLAEAGRQALKADRVELALRCFRAAEEALLGDQERLAIGSEMVRSLWRTKPEIALRKLRALARPISAGRMSPTSALAIVPCMLWHGLEDEALCSLELADQAGFTDPAMRAIAHTIVLWLKSTYPGMVHHHGDLTERISAQIHADPRGREDPGNNALWALLSALRDQNTEQVIARAEQTLQSVRIADNTLETVTAATLALVYAGRLDLADTWCQRLERQLAGRAAPTCVALLSAVRGQIAAQRGDLSVAARLATEALRGMSSTAWGVGIGLPLSTAIYAAVGMGDYPTAERLLTQPVPERLFETRFGMHYLAARGRYHLDQGHLHAALADFLSCGERARAWGFASPSLVPWRLGAAEAWVRLGNDERAVRLIEEHLDATPQNRPGPRGAALRVLAMTVKPDERPELLGQALQLLQTTTDRYGLALALADLGDAYRQLGEFAKARTFARRAWRIAKACGAKALYRSLFPSTHGRVLIQDESAQPSAEKVGSLTEAERRVGSLAAQGHSNRDIAGLLFITVSTVEQHLTRIYRKLNVRHRQDLPMSLAFDAPGRGADLTAGKVLVSQ